MMVQVWARALLVALVEAALLAHRVAQETLHLNPHHKEMTGVLGQQTMQPMRCKAAAAAQAQ
jgi:hypothetical protein